MSTSAASGRRPVEATGVAFSGEALTVRLSDGRNLQINLHGIPALRWLLDATDEERRNWEIEPGGFAVYWPDLDDGIEVAHLLDPFSLTA